MKSRPKLKLKLSTTDKILEALGWGSVLIIWGLTITNFSNLPDTIPIHYNGAGQADGFGDKSNILGLPIIATILFLGLTVLNRFPHIFNYTTEITKNNALQQYTYATRMLRILKLIVVIIFGLIVLQTIRHVNGQISGLGGWFLPLTFGLTFIPILYYLIKSSQS